MMSRYRQNVCDEWRGNPKAFCEWGLANGWSEGLVLTRNDNTLSFCPSNCQFVDRSVISTKVANSEEVRQKTKTTNLHKYGVESYTQTKEYKERVKKTNVEKRGVEYIGQDNEVKNKVRATVRERYGVDCVLQAEEVKDKIIATNLERYGVDRPAKTESVKNKIVESQKRSGIIKLLDGKTRREWAKECDISYSGFNVRVRKYGLDAAIKMERHQTEIEFVVEEILKRAGIHYLKNIAIENRIADFVIPSKQLIIEVDGLYWHSDAINGDKRYHRKKMELYHRHGYSTLFFREDEISRRRPLVESIIRNRLGLSDIVYGRKLTLTDLDRDNSKDFFNTNHLMGFGSGLVMGLYDGCGIRCAIQIVNKGEYVYVSRFCNAVGITVIGGLSKLLSAIYEDYKKDVVSFVDLRYGNGKSLEKLGFIAESERLSFKWVKNDSTYHRMKFPSDSGYSFGCFKIWDCGQRKYRKKLL